MLTYSETIALRDKLASGEIGVQAAQALYWQDFKEGQRSWHSKDWKERRAQIIKDKCEICSSNDTLTIQHRSHPKKYAEVLREAKREKSQQYSDTIPMIAEAEFTKYILNKYDYIPTPFCPNCNCSHPKERVRKTPTYRCAACRQEFDRPHYKSVKELISIFYADEDAIEVRDKCFVSKDRWKNTHNLSNIRYWLRREQVEIAYAEAIQQEAFLLYLNDTIIYLSFEDTITACKKCAAAFDLHNMELCPKCNKFYKGLQYPTCIQCLPEEKRKAALESIEFGKAWREMHQQLGID